MGDQRARDAAAPDRRHLQTVRGPIEVSELGVTLAHEHLLVDITTYWDPAGPIEAADPDRPMDMALLGRIRRDPVGVTRDNLRIDDRALVVRELAAFTAARGRSLIDVTPKGAGLDPRGIRRIAEAAGVHVVLGTAYYLERTHPRALAGRAVDSIADEFARDLEEGFPGADGIRAGVIGEIGTSDPIGPGERRVLRAAARAQARTGAGLVVHLQEWGANGHEVLDIAEAEGADPSRVALAHLDSRLDVEYHASLAARGALLSYDLFGTEEYRVREHRGNPSDWERVRAIAALVEGGHADRLLLSTDVCTKAQLAAYGGCGFGHVLVNIVPMLLDAGVRTSAIDAMLVENPARLLAGDPTA